MNENKLKEILAEGKIAFGTCIYSFSPAIVELAGYCGLDFCRIDNEHAWRQDESTENLMRAAEVSGVVPLLRVDKGNLYLIRKALEIGAGGVIVPHINTKKEAVEAVETAKFPPIGKRGFGGLCRSGKWGTWKALEWIKWSNEKTLIGAMIEDYRALENIDEIMSVKGLDFVMFGSADYAISIGVPGQKGHPKVIQALKETIETAEKYSKYVMINVGYPWIENAKKFIELGCRMIEVGHDISILKTIWKNILDKIGCKENL